MKQPLTGLALRNLSKRYGDLVALDDMSLHVAPGEMHGFVGPNGAGKTTAMRIAIGVLAPDRGEVLWNGEPAGTDARRSTGYMPEERGLYPKMKVSDHLEYLAELHGRDAATARERTRFWLERLGIADRASNKVEELSLGNQQRVQLAASLIFDPDLLILDEPFSGLDPIGVDVLSDVLAEVCAERQVPVLFSSHQLELVERLCDRVTIIKAGRMVASGGVDELRETRSAHLWRLALEDGGGARGSDSPGQAATPLPQGVHRHADGIYRLEPGVDPSVLLEFGSSIGAVREFGPEQATLAGLFRETISEESGETTERAAK